MQQVWEGGGLFLQAPWGQPPPAQPPCHPSPSTAGTARHRTASPSRWPSPPQGTEQEQGGSAAGTPPSLSEHGRSAGISTQAGHTGQGAAWLGESPPVPLPPPSRSLVSLRGWPHSFGGGSAVRARGRPPTPGLPAGPAAGKRGDSMMHPTWFLRCKTGARSCGPASALTPH